jgi:hypothetical protein
MVVVVLVKYDFVLLVVSEVCLVCSDIGKTVTCKSVRVPIVLPSIIRSAVHNFVLRAHDRSKTVFMYCKGRIVSSCYIPNLPTARNISVLKRNRIIRGCITKCPGASFSSSFRIVRHFT